MRLHENEYEGDGGSHGWFRLGWGEYAISRRSVKLDPGRWYLPAEEDEMSGSSRWRREVLTEVVAVAREVLRDMDDDAVPPRLDAVRRRTGPRLPPPLTVSLLDEVERHEALREAVLERWEGSGHDEPVGTAFLRRPDGWWTVVADAMVERAVRREEQTLQESTARAEELARRWEECKQRLQAERRRASELERDHRRRLDEATAGLRDALDAHRRAARQAQDEAESIRAELQAAESRVAESGARVAALTEEVRALRAERAELHRLLAEGERRSIPRDPLELARFLDRVAAATVPYREGAAAPAARPPHGDSTLALPPGVRPDTAAAIEALGRLQVPFRVLVDGHNVLGTRSAGLLGDPAARRRLVADLGRLAKRLGHPVEVIFDSSLGSGREGFVTAGVTASFAPEDRTADDVIVERAGPDTVVVSNDREVREAAEGRGALPVWADALIGWLRR